MADTSVAITPGTGANIDARTEATNGDYRQVVILGDPSVNAGVAGVVATAPGVSDYGIETRQVGLPQGAALADGTTNPTTIIQGSAGHGWNNATWDRIRSSGNNSDAVTVVTTGVQLQNAFQMVFNSTSWDRRLGATHGTNSVGTGLAANVILAEYDDSAPTGISDNQFGNLRMSANRNLYATLRDAAGNERGLNITANNAMPIEGPTPTGATFVAQPLPMGGRSANVLPAANNNTLVVPAMFDKYGRQVVLTGSLRDLRSTQTTTITSSTGETTVITAGASGVFNDVVLILISNTSVTATRMDIRDATSGSILGSIYIPAGDCRGFAIPGEAIPQTTAANNWTVQSSQSVSDLRIFAVYDKNK